MKYIIIALSTTLFLSLMLHVAHYEDIYYTREHNKLSDQIIQNMSKRITELELQSVD